MDNIKRLEEEVSFLCFAKHVTTPKLWRKHFSIGCWIIVELLCDPQLPITPFSVWVCKYIYMDQHRIIILALFIKYLYFGLCDSKQFCNAKC